MKKLIQDFDVLKRKDLNKDHFVLDIRATEQLPPIKPGQFVNVLIKNSKNTFLRRPFSIHFVDYEKNIIKLFIKRVGEGTQTLGDIEPNEKLNLIYPLGNSYSIPEKTNTLLIGGGCGIAPLLYLSKFLYDAGNKVTTILGFRSSCDVVEIEDFEKYGDVFVTTEDGTMGEKGYPTQHYILEQNNNLDNLFACGPEPMLKVLASYACKKGINCEVSLENTMACGFGACLCCVTETIEGHKCVCTDGPIFNINKLTW